MTTQRGHWYFYSPNQWRYVTTPGEVSAYVLGRPFDMPRAAFEKRVTDAMDGRPIWSPARYVTTSSDVARGAYWVVLVFNPPIGYDGYDACARRDEGGGPAGGDVRLVAAFCSTVHMLSEVHASAFEVNGPNDPLFDDLIRHTMIQLLPTRPPNIGPAVWLGP